MCSRMAATVGVKQADSQAGNWRFLRSKFALLVEIRRVR